MIFWSLISFRTQFTKNAVVIAPRIKLKTMIIMSRWSSVCLSSSYNKKNVSTDNTFLCHCGQLKLQFGLVILAHYGKFYILTLQKSPSSFINLQLFLLLHFKSFAMHVSSSQSNSSSKQAVNESNNREEFINSEWKKKEISTGQSDIFVVNNQIEKLCNAADKICSMKMRRL